MAHVVKRIFNAGELSPKVYARTDLDKYEGGARTMLNTLPLPQGGVVRRPGFEYVAGAKNNNAPVRLLPFQFSTNQAYVIEAGNSYMRFYKDGGQIQTVDANTSLLLHFEGANASTTFTDTGNNSHTVAANGNAQIRTDQKKFGSGSAYFDGTNDFISIADHADWNFGNNNFTIEAWCRFENVSRSEGFGILGQYDDAGNYLGFYYIGNNTQQLKFWVKSGNNSIVNMTGNFNAAANNWYHLAVIRGWGNDANNFALTVNGVAVTANNYAITMPDLAGDLWIGKWQYSAGVDGDFQGFIDEVRISKTVARQTANFNVPQQAYPEADGSGAVYELNTTYTADELADLQYAQSYDTMYITHRNHAPAKLTRTAHNNWNLADIQFLDGNNNNVQPAEWSNNNGWPRTCAFYQDRLVFASTTSLPSRLWFSKTGNYEDLTTGANDDDGFTVNLLSGSSDVIFWLTSGKRLVCGTDAGVQSLAAASGSNTAITPTNKFNRKESYFGTSEIFPVKLGDIIIYAGNPASKVRELAYSWEADGYKSTEMTVLADHLLEGRTVREFAYQQSPYEIVWCRRSDNTLLALTYMQEQNVIAWSRHTSGNIASIAVIPGDTESEFYVAVHRNVNNSTVTFIERMRKFEQVSFNNSFFLDAGLQYVGGNAVSVITGLDHLEGSNVQYLADGAIGAATIANNQLALNNAASVVTVGFNYNSDIEPLPPNFESQDGSTIFREKRITEIQVLARNSGGATYGPDANNQTPLFANNTMTNAAAVNLSLRGGYNHSKTVFIRQSDPLPLNIDAIGFEVEI